MIIVKLMGGLGNQMFQYAAGCRLAHMHNTDLKLDLSFLLQPHEEGTPRRFELPHLNIHAVIAKPFEVAKISGQGRNLLETVCVRLLQASGMTRLRKNVYLEPHFHYDAGFEGLPDNTYLEGYWQSEKYFSPIADIIRRDFAVKAPLQGQNRELADHIASSTSVSVHIRRGDYVTNAKTAEYHGICGIDYYQYCAKAVIERVEQPHFFVFSDDPDWVRKNLLFPSHTTFIAHNGPERAYEDLRLLSFCRHHIIANSSFSWWGAWLSANPGKLVYAPARWFTNPDLDTRDLRPASWIKVDI